MFLRALAASASAAVSASACQPLLRASVASNTRLVSRAYTRVTIIGRIGADPELRTLESGTKVVSFPLAAHRSGGQDGKEITMWFRCYFFDQPKLTQYVDEQVTKGALVVVDGELTQRQVPGANGKEVTFTEVNIGRTSLACGFCQEAACCRHCLTNSLSLSGLLVAFWLPWVFLSLSLSLFRAGGKIRVLAKSSKNAAAAAAEGATEVPINVA
jgi:single-strand DNA-binding protein